MRLNRVTLNNLNRPCFDEKIDLLVDQGETKIGTPTTIVDLTGDEIKILRKGSISEKRILEILSTN